MSEDLKTPEVNHESENEPDESVTVAELAIGATITGLMLYMIYLTTLNAAFAEHQRQIEEHIIDFLDGGTKKQEFTVSYLSFFKKSISLSKEGDALTVDLGSDENFKKHCMRTNFEILSKKAAQVEVSFDKISSTCTARDGKSVFSFNVPTPEQVVKPKLPAF